MARYSTILFDADETLMDFVRGERLALHEVFEKNGLRTDAEFLSVYDAVNHDLWDRYNRGEIKKKEITDTRFQKLFDHFSIALDGAEFNERYIACLANYGYLLPGALELCQRLFEHGMDMYIITNGIGMVQKSRFEKSGLAPYFGGVFVSEEIGVGKPHKAFFDYVLDKVPEKDTQKIIVVGDSLTADIEGGIRANLITCWCDFKKTNKENKASFRVENFAELEKILTEDENAGD